MTPPPSATCWNDYYNAAVWYEIPAPLQDACFTLRLEGTTFVEFFALGGDDCENLACVGADTDKSPMQITFQAFAGQRYFAVIATSDNVLLTDVDYRLSVSVSGSKSSAQRP